MINYRAKVEKRLKRKLKSTEIVHHADGDNYNDTHKNLKVISSQSEHVKIPKITRKIETRMYNDILSLLDRSISSDFKKALHTLFTPYQITIIYRRLQNKSLSKTDSEVFSRVIRKKLVALANNQLFEIAQKMLHQ